MKATNVAVAVAVGGVAAALGYLAGVQVGFSGGVRAASDVTGHDPREVAHAIKQKSRSASDNPRMR